MNNKVWTARLFPIENLSFPCNSQLSLRCFWNFGGADASVFEEGAAMAGAGQAWLGELRQRRALGSSQGIWEHGQNSSSSPLASLCSQGQTHLLLDYCPSPRNRWSKVIVANWEQRQRSPGFCFKVILWDRAPIRQHPSQHRVAGGAANVSEQHWSLQKHSWKVNSL